MPSLAMPSGSMSLSLTFFISATRCLFQAFPRGSLLELHPFDLKSTFSSRKGTLPSFIVNSPSGHSSISVVFESGSDICSVSSDCVFFFPLPFVMSCNFLLQGGHVASGNRNWDKQAFCMRAYDNLAGCWAVFNVHSCVRQYLHVSLMPWLLSPLLPLGFPKSPLQR